MTSFYGPFAALCLSISVGPCWADSASYNEFVREVGIVVADYDPFFAWKGYGYSPHFAQFGARAAGHIDDCVRYLSEDGHSDLERGAASMLLSRLSLPDYLAFIRTLIELHDARHVSKDELIAAIGHYEDTGPNVLFEHYADPGVQALIADVLSRPEFEVRERKFIEWTANGGNLEFKIHRGLRALGLE